MKSATSEKPPYLSDRQGLRCTLSEAIFSGSLASISQQALLMTCSLQIPCTLRWLPPSRALHHDEKPEIKQPDSCNSLQGASSTLAAETPEPQLLSFLPPPLFRTQTLSLSSLFPLYFLDTLLQMICKCRQSNSWWPIRWSVDNCLCSNVWCRSRGSRIQSNCSLIKVHSHLFYFSPLSRQSPPLSYAFAHDTSQSIRSCRYLFGISEDQITARESANWMFEAIDVNNKV